MVAHYIERGNLASYQYLENIEDLVFMQDGAPPHFTTVVCEWLNAHFHGRWMGRDLAPCDIFLWGWLKEQVYSTRPTTLEEYDVWIHEAMSSIPHEFLV